ncbi:hypothetical protein [Solimicrobium silvestre]|uniref:Uncharacterized protein n=1 Tax=Solimicrobium silvestre TaxID=2099400 RepID=A0A2S9H3Y1_9BURK|nr:hypothetical protein [Solimicrobium silvestre]PRC94692.1 hypothetical protein S2091_0695 [Solimicrobium silvestre]
MNRKFLIYAIVVTVLTTGITWQKLVASESNDQNRSGASRGSGWSSFMGNGSLAGGSGGHK